MWKGYIRSFGVGRMKQKRQLADFLSRNISSDDVIPKEHILCLLVEFEEEFEGDVVQEKSE